jgi:hypothetical protein
MPRDARNPRLPREREKSTELNTRGESWGKKQKGGKIEGAS